MGNTESSNIDGTDCFECSELLKKYNIKTLKDFRIWALKNHPDKGGETDTFAKVSSCADEYFKQKNCEEQLLFNSNKKQTSSPTYREPSPSYRKPSPPPTYKEPSPPPRYRGPSQKEPSPSYRKPSPPPTYKEPSPPPRYRGPSQKEYENMKIKSNKRKNTVKNDIVKVLSSYSDKIYKNLGFVNNKEYIDKNREAIVNICLVMAIYIINNNQSFKNFMNGEDIKGINEIVILKAIEKFIKQNNEKLIKVAINTYNEDL